MAIILEPVPDIDVVFEGTPMRLSKWYQSYMPVLMKVMAITTGNVIEIGTGIYSTPYLHWACFMDRRQLTSYENSETYLKLAHQYSDDFHDVCFVKNFNELNSPDCDVALVDNFPLEDRKFIVERLANHAKYIIVHDTNLAVYESCKYRFDYLESTPNTSIFSNFIDVSNFKI